MKNFVEAKITDKIEQFYDNGKIVATNFLDPSEIVQVKTYLKYIEHMVWGGFDDAERKIVIIGDDKLNLAKQDFITAIRVKSSMKLSHRSVLGSILGLGIKREMLGDIVISNNMCDIIVIKGIAQFIIQNFKYIGREKISAFEIGFQEMIIPEDNSVETKISVSSLRVDAIISAGYGISREKSSEFIKSESVKINHVLVKSLVKQIREGDLISVRGKGRLEIIRICGTSKSGRIRVEISKK